MSADVPNSPEQTDERHPEALVLLDAQGRVRHLNADQGVFLGFRNENLVGKIFTECLHPDDQAQDCFAMDELEATGPVQFDARLLIGKDMSPLLSLQVWEAVDGRCVLLRLPTALTLDFDRRLLEVQKLEGLGVLAPPICLPVEVEHRSHHVLLEHS